MANAAEAKKIRTVSKGRFTRCENSLFQLMGKNVIEEDFEEPLKEWNDAYQLCQDTRTKFCLLLADETEIENEEAWMDDIKQRYDGMCLNLRDYQRKVKAQNESKADADLNSTLKRKKKVKVKAEKADKPSFSGKCLDYHQFKRDFKFIYDEGEDDDDKYTDEEQLYCLRRCVPKTVKSWLDGKQSMSEAWSELD